MGVALLPIAVIFMTVALPMLILFFLALAMLFRGRRGTAGQAEAMRQLERTWTLLGKMEDRITNLETILIERSRPAGAESKGESSFRA